MGCGVSASHSVRKILLENRYLLWDFRTPLQCQAVHWSIKWHESRINSGVMISTHDFNGFHPPHITGRQATYWLISLWYKMYATCQIMIDNQWSWQRMLTYRCSTLHSSSFSLIARCRKVYFYRPRSREIIELVASVCPFVCLLVLSCL